jgi:hypothetical protein
MLIWAMLDCRYKLDHIGVDGTSWKEQKRRRSVKAQSSRQDWDPGDWIKGQESGKNSRISRPRESKRLN